MVIGSLKVHFSIGATIVAALKTVVVFFIYFGEDTEKIFGPALINIF